MSTYLSSCRNEMTQAVSQLMARRAATFARKGPPKPAGGGHRASTSRHDKKPPWPASLIVLLTQELTPIQTDV
jgi:hypothetical protein